MASQKRHTRLTLAIFWLALPALLATTAADAQAVTMSVKQFGCGAEAACYGTLNGAMAVVQDGDTVKVYPGTYEEAIVISKSIVLQGAGPQFTTISGVQDAITVENTAHATISGFTIQSSAGNGIYIKKGSSLVLAIKNNSIVGNAGSGVNSDYNKYGTITIVNNVISYNAGNGVRIYDYYNDGNAVNVASNIIAKNGGYGIFFDCYFHECSSYKASSNDLFANTSASTNSSSGATISANLSLDPLFIDATNGNYALQSSSPCKNAGSPGAADPDGTNNDMGAFGGPGAAAFWPYPQGAPVITNLTATPSSVQKGGTITITATGQATP